MVKQLGHSKLFMNPIIMGCWQIGGKPHWHNIDDQESIRALNAAFDAGINSFDTAPGYGDGHSERILGKAFKGRREEVIILDKVFADKLSYDLVIKSCENSLKNLQTDYIDLFQIHFPSGCFGTKEVPIEETMSAFNDLKKQGKIKEIGVSNFSLQELENACEYADVVSIQPPYSLFWQHNADEVREYCIENNIEILAYSPLAQGLLSGRYSSKKPFPKEDMRNTQKLYNQDNIKKVEQAIFLLEPIAEDYGITLGELALSWLISKPKTMAIVGTRTEQQAKTNANISNIYLDEKTLQQIERIGHEVASCLSKEDNLMWHF